MTREEWLQAAAVKLSALIQKAGEDVPGSYISVGFPKGARVGRGRRAVGQCWDGALSSDSKPHIFICPTQQQDNVLHILLHELIHAVVGTEAAHRGPFITLAKKVGLVRPWTATSPGEELLQKLNDIAKELGPYPHALLVPVEKKKKGSRLRLWECECKPPVKVRVAKDDFQATCQVCGKDFALPGLKGEIKV